MSDDGEDCAGLCILTLALIVIAFIFMTIASPGFLIYAFFSGEWLLENRTALSNVTEDTVFYGLYRRCHNESCSDFIVHDLTFGLEVTSIAFQFLAILALPWLKPCLPDSKCLMNWNYCFIPFLFLAAIFSLSASIIFSNEYASKDPNMSTGTSQVCAGLGGGFQIVLACFITGFLGHKELLCCQSPTTEVVPYNEHHSMAATSFMKTESFFSAVFAYKSTTYVDGNTIVHEEELYAERVEQQRAAIGYGYDRY